MTKLKVGIVGYGIMGQLYTDFIHHNDKSIVTAIADHNLESLKLAKRVFECATFTEYEKMFKTIELDLVIITLPDFLHKEAVIMAAKQGFNILVEKPFATSLKDAEAMSEQIERSKVKCMVEFFNRWSPPFTNAYQRVKNGDLGELISFSIDLNDSIDVPTKMLKWSSKSSPAWFLMSHTADLAFWITGERPTSVYAKGVKKLLPKLGVNTFDTIEAIVDFQNGAVGRFTNCWVLPSGLPLVYELKMRLVGEKASIDIDTSDQEIHLITSKKVEHPITDWGNILGYHIGHPYTMLQSFIDNIIYDTEPLVSHLDGWANTKFLESVHLSVKKGERIPLKW